MAYKIAVASSDGANVDLHFGEAESLNIYEVLDDGSFSLLEKRKTSDSSGESVSESCGQGRKDCQTGGCRNSNGSGGGCGNGAASAKVEGICDVRAVVAARIGFNVTKALEKKAIASFDVECPVQEALEKITKYFYSVDNHIRFKK